MSRQRLTKAVIQFFENKNYKYTKFLGSGGFADIIAVLDPTGREVAVKIVQEQDVWHIEDQYWPRLKHQHLLEVFEVITVEELNVMPVLPRTLDDIVKSKKFRKNPESFKRIKKWIFQILLAIEHLHSNGLVHLDIKSDNILIDNEDNAVLADFTGLNFAKDPIQR